MDKKKLEEAITTQKELKEISSFIDFFQFCGGGTLKTIRVFGITWCPHRVKEYNLNAEMRNKVLEVLKERRDELEQKLKEL